MTPPGTFWGQEPTFVSAPRQALHRTPHKFAVSLRTPKAPLRVVCAERHLVGLEEHRA